MGNLAALTTILMLLLTCVSKDEQIAEITMDENDITSVDSAFYNVFRKLDGRWDGTFHIYSVEVGQKNVKDIPTALTKDYVNKLNPTLEMTIDVTQRYRSSTPYHQYVQIWDSLPDNTVEKSYGMNKVQHGQLWCIVEKPNEKIIHQGSSPTKDVIIWQRNEDNPTRKEYFYESVSDSTYEIVGYGYYGDHDTRKFPSTWFYGLYHRYSSQ